MKCKTLVILTLLINLTAFCQEDSTPRDSTEQNERDLYIEDFTRQLNIKLEANNDVQKFHIPFEDRIVDIEPNLGLKYGLAFSYKFLSIRIGIRPNISEESKKDKGESESSRFRVKFLFDKWTYKLEYNRIKGFYITDSKSMSVNQNFENHIQFPNLESKVVLLSAAYKFNDYYSVRALESQVERQKKSIGSFVPSLDIWFYKFTDSQTIINGDGETIERTNYMESNGIDFIVNAGYFYTFVYKNWYANAKLIPGIGIDFNSTTSYTENSSSTSNFRDLVLSIEPGAGIGYNSKKIFFGASFSRKMTNQKSNDKKFHFNITKNSFFVFFGYRFKAPKTVTKTVDKIENTVPLLKKEENKN